MQIYMDVLGVYEKKFAVSVISILLVCLLSVFQILVYGPTSVCCGLLGRVNNRVFPKQVNSVASWYSKFLITVAQP